MKKIEKLSELEIRIMRVLWEQEEHLTIKQMTKELESEGISVQSITQVIKRLMDKRAVTVVENVPAGNVYARAFRPAYSREEFLEAELERLQMTVLGRKKKSLAGMMANFLCNSNDKKMTFQEAGELRKMVEEKRNIRKKADQ